MKKLKIAIIGAGSIGQRHAEHINNLARLTAVCDIKKELAQSTANKYQCNFYDNIDELLENEKETDLIAVCTPNAIHAEHSIKSFRAGKHVLCEKPMAITVKDCEKMITEAERANRRLFVVKQNRFNPPVARLKELLEERKLGQILSVQLNCFWNRNDEYYRSSDWKGTKALDGGTLFTQFSHFIDLLLWLVGDINKIYAITKNLAHINLVEFEDSGVIALEFDNGALGTINYTVNSYKKNMEGSIAIFGEYGTVKVGGQYLNVLEYQSLNGFEINDIDESRPANDYGFYQGSMSNHDKVYENLIDVLTNGGSISTNALEGLKTVQVIERIYKASKNGHLTE